MTDTQLDEEKLTLLKNEEGIDDDNAEDTTESQSINGNIQAKKFERKRQE